MAKYHFCFAIGMADFMPDEQYYHSADSVLELREIALTFMKGFRDEQDAYLYPLPSSVANTLFNSPNASMLNWRLAIAKDTDRTLDLIGMTEAEWLQQIQEDCNA
jgi:hypothetical protein